MLSILMPIYIFAQGKFGKNICSSNEIHFNRWAYLKQTPGFYTKYEQFTIKL